MFKLIYRILNSLEQASKVESFDANILTSEHLKATEVEIDRALKMLIDEGCIKGIEVLPVLGGKVLSVVNPEITLRGLTYLHTDELMKNVEKQLKGIN